MPRLVRPLHSCSPSLNLRQAIPEQVSKRRWSLWYVRSYRSDFARHESETKASEATAQKEHDEFMTESKVDKSKMYTDIEHKTANNRTECRR